MPEQTTATDSVSAVLALIDNCPTDDPQIAYERASNALEMVVNQLARDRVPGGSPVAMTNVPALMARVAAKLQGPRRNTDTEAAPR